MNIEQVREFTLSLPGVTEDQPFGDDNITFRLEGKIFECLWLGGGSRDMADAEPIQMLGLWPECNYNAVVEFYVDPTMLFRPSADPSITTTTSGVDFPSWADEKYTVGETNFREWFAYQKSVAYVGDGACPWTQLGYTYDWHHNADPKGLSEYRATVGALALIKTRQGSWTFIRQNTH